MNIWSSSKQRGKGGFPRFCYQDSLPILCGALVMTGVFCFYRYQEELFRGMLSDEMKVVGWACFMLCLGVLGYIAFTIPRLDRAYPWLDNWFMRLVYQLLHCCLFPFGFLFLVYTAVPQRFTLPVLQLHFFYTDAFPIMLILLLINIFYGVAYFIALHHWHRRLALLKDQRYSAEKGRLKEDLKEKELLVERVQDNVESLKSEFETYREDVGRLLAKLQEPEKKVYLLELGGSTLRFPFEEIACYYTIHDKAFMRLLSGEEFVVPEKSLKLIEEITGGYFRRVNRSYLVPQHAIDSCVRIKNKGLCLILKDKDKTKVRLSNESEKSLKHWILEVVDIEAREEDI